MSGEIKEERYGQERRWKEEGMKQFFNIFLVMRLREITEDSLVNVLLEKKVGAYSNCLPMVYSISPSLLVQRRSMISSAGTGHVQSL